MTLFKSQQEIRDEQQAAADFHAAMTDDDWGKLVRSQLPPDLPLSVRFVGPFKPYNTPHIAGAGWFVVGIKHTDNSFLSESMGEQFSVWFYRGVKDGRAVEISDKASSPRAFRDLMR